ncbi:MAG: hypothetical protein H7Y88_09020 [Phycisphaerales bacterium]|nr:hypothetical protein [Phycisphaerales bacterium]
MSRTISGMNHSTDEGYSGTPEMVADGRAFSEDVHPAFNRSKFLMRQKLLTLHQKYTVWDEQGQPIMWVERRHYHLRSILAILAVVGIVLVGLVVTGVAAAAVADAANEVLAIVTAIVLGLAFVAAAIGAAVGIMPRRHVGFYADEAKTAPLLAIIQDSKWQILQATYTVTDAGGTPVGYLRKNFLWDLLQKRWQIKGADGTVIGVAHEEASIIICIMKKVMREYLPIRINFVIKSATPDGRAGEILGHFNRKYTLLDKYVLDLSPDTRHWIDRRLGAALGVMLDSAERR